MPGVTGVTASLVPLLAGNNWGNSVSVQGFEPAPTPTRTRASTRWARTTSATLGIPLLAGREFTPPIADGAPRSPIVNEAFAKKFNLGRDAVGKHIGDSTGNTVKLDIEIVGLVAEREIQRGEAGDPAGVLPALPAGRTRRCRWASTCGRALRPSSCCRRSPAPSRGSIRICRSRNCRTMPQQVRENVFLDRIISDAVDGVRRARDGARGHRALRRARLHRGAAYARDRPADGARRRAADACAAMVLRQVGVMTLIGGTIGLAAAVWARRGRRSRCCSR